LQTPPIRFFNAFQTRNSSGSGILTPGGATQNNRLISAENYRSVGPLCAGAKNANHGKIMARDHVTNAVGIVFICIAKDLPGKRSPTGNSDVSHSRNLSSWI